MIIVVFSIKKLLMSIDDVVSSKRERRNCSIINRCIIILWLFLSFICLTINWHFEISILLFFNVTRRRLSYLGELLALDDVLLIVISFLKLTSVLYNTSLNVIRVKDFLSFDMKSLCNKGFDVMNWSAKSFGLQRILWTVMNSSSSR